MSFDKWSLQYQVYPGKWVTKQFDTITELNEFSTRLSRERQERIARNCTPYLSEYKQHQNDVATLDRIEEQLASSWY